MKILIKYLPWAIIALLVLLFLRKPKQPQYDLAQVMNQLDSIKVRTILKDSTTKIIYEPRFYPMEVVRDGQTEELIQLRDKLSMLGVKLSELESFLEARFKAVGKGTIVRDTVKGMIAVKDGYLDLEADSLNYEYTYTDTLQIVGTQKGKKFEVTARASNPNAAITSVQTFDIISEKAKRISSVTGIDLGINSSVFDAGSIEARAGISHTMIGKRGAILSLSGGYQNRLTDKAHGIYGQITGTIPVRKSRK